ncbi:MAG: hypothetical protein LBP91_00385 [Coriobacteriales bacterium]|nr:hypothetical protein [Coriobacteriales bacterium]
MSSEEQQKKIDSLDTTRDELIQSMLAGVDQSVGEAAEQPFEQGEEQPEEKAAEQAAQAAQAEEQPEEQLADPSVEQPEEQPVEQQTDQPEKQTDLHRSHLSRHFKPVSEKKLAHARRTKRSLITGITFFSLLLCGAVAAGIYFYLEFVPAPASLIQDTLTIDTNGQTVEDRGVAKTVPMPALGQLFGRTPEEALAILGSSYAITKVDATQANATNNAADDPAARQVVTISYTPEAQNGAADLRQTQKIYLSLGEAGTTIEVYLVSSMDILDLPHSSFADLVATQENFLQSLTSAAVAGVSDTPYIAPTSGEYTEFVDPTANHKKVKKESATWAGALASEAAPTKFEVTFTYEYGASGVEDTLGKHPSQRMLYIKLS